MDLNRCVLVYVSKRHSKYEIDMEDTRVPDGCDVSSCGGRTCVDDFLRALKSFVCWEVSTVEMESCGAPGFASFLFIDRISDGRAIGGVRLLCIDVLPPGLVSLHNVSVDVCVSVLAGCSVFARSLKAEIWVGRCFEVRELRRPGLSMIALDF